MREQARSITQLELLPEPPPKRPDALTPWPQWPLKYRLSYAMEEAKTAELGEQDYSVTTTRFRDDPSGRVAALQIARAEDKPPFGPVAGTEQELPAQLVLLAMGFLYPEPALLDDLGVQRDERGNCKTESLYATSADGVPSAVYGCTPFNMGAPDEYILLDELLAVAKVHTLAAFDFLSEA